MTERELIYEARQKSTRERKPTIPEVIADLAGVPDRDFICGHSLKPFWGGFEDDPAWYSAHGKNERSRNSENIFPRNQKLIFFCAKCATNDLRLRGRSYWRRSHQIPGVCWCSKHKSPLLTCPSSKISEQPHCLAALAIPCINAPFPTKKSITGRYLSVIAYLLTLRRPIPTAQLCERLAMRLSEKGIAWHPNEHKRTFLSDIVLKRCTSDWCQQLFEDFSLKQPREYFSKIDACPINIGNLATSYTLALAALFDTSGEVAKVVTSCFVPSPRDLKALQLAIKV